MSRRVIFSDDAWQEYVHWQETDRKVLRKINSLIKECQRTPEEGSGRPEALRFEYAGWWSRRIDEEHRLIYRADEQGLEIAQCRYHYRKN